MKPILIAISLLSFIACQKVTEEPIVNQVLKEIPPHGTFQKAYVVRGQPTYSKDMTTGQEQVSIDTFALYTHKGYTIGQKNITIARKDSTIDFFRMH